MLDARAFRQVMSSFPTGVTVVTGVDAAGIPLGLTVNSFTSVSLDPPLVLVCIGRDASSHDALVAGAGFAVNILADDQDALARRFASEPAPDRFDGVAWARGPTGAPVLEGAAAWLACAVDAVHPGGDHSILVGRVETGAASGRGALAFYRGSLGPLAP